MILIVPIFWLGNGWSEALCWNYRRGARPRFQESHRVPKQWRRRKRQSEAHTVGNHRFRWWGKPSNRQRHTRVLNCDTSYRSVLSKWEFFIKMRAAYLLSPSFITQGRMGASKAALILIRHYSIRVLIVLFWRTKKLAIKGRLRFYSRLSIGKNSINQTQ